MSQENVEALPIGPAWEAISRMDDEVLIAVCDPDVTFESRITAVEASRYHGYDGIRRYIATLAEAFEWNFTRDDLA